MTRVYVIMVADLFHYGHVEFLRRARGFGDYLIAGLTTDGVAADRKRKPIMSLEERISVVQACRYVDETWPHQGPVCNEFMEKNNLSFKVSAPKDVAEEQMRLQRYARQGLDLKYHRTVPYTPAISTTEILDRIVKRYLSDREL